MTTIAAGTDRLSRRRLLALGVSVPVFAIAGRVALTGAHEGSHGESTAEAASPVASPVVGADTGTAAAYMTIQNTGSHNETLLGARTAVARSVELHTMTVGSNGVMSMQPVPSGVEIPAGAVLDLSPQSYHFMLVDLAQDLLPNTTYEMVLRFAQAGEVAVTVAVQMTAPTDTQTVSGRGQDVSIFEAWSRPAPRIDGVTTSSEATPAASPDPHHHG
jgi:copper(I)-binding protein